MTPEEADKTINEYLMPNLQGKTEFKYIAPGTASVHLTPDDILTLRLLRDDVAKQRAQEPNWVYYRERQVLFDTLNRILKQVE